MTLFKIIPLFFFRKIIFLLKKILYFKKNEYRHDKTQINNYHQLIKKNGFHIIENFLDKKNCDLIIDELDRFHDSNRKMSWHDEFNCEYRLFGAEKINKKVFSFFSDPLLFDIGSKCFGGVLSNLMTMANRIEYKINNEGSGSGWHRDDINFQFKAILYLNDVNIHNGPFQLIQKSNNFFNCIRDSKDTNFNLLNTRIGNSSVELLDKKRLKTIIGKAGTLILVDTSLIHRGKPLSEGFRYALTNYYYPHYQIKSMKNNFLPKIKN